MNRIHTVLVANRGEIAIRVFRACNELGIRTVAIFSNEDMFSLHRFKADEAYLVGEGKSPVGAYLDIESIIRVAKKHDVDAIHPGYGFLAENMDLAKRCQEEGILFIGPEIRHLDMFGDKVKARKQAQAAGIPTVPGTTEPVRSFEELQKIAADYGFPIIIKASSGGGGRGMRIVRSADSLKEAYQRAKSEALASFGNDEIYVEKLLENIKHVEVQILGDTHGNLIHLYDRDCSVQRRHQKVVEIAPSVGLSEEFRLRICDAAVKLMKHVGYVSAGTVEFLTTPDEKFYFIEVNPRIQVEHTITEMITGVDIVQSQLLVADGYSLHGKEAGIPQQAAIPCHGHALQCRVTTEDPANNFMPDTGKITVYRSPGGFGLRLDGSNAYAGSTITPYYDSLLVKVSSWNTTYAGAIRRMRRALSEFRIRGLKTNIAFLENVMKHPQFVAGTCTTAFIDESPELFVMPERKDRATKLLNYLGDVVVNGTPGLPKAEKPITIPPRIPTYPATAVPQSGTKQILDAHGPAGLVKWIKAQPEVLLTDTTLRDAHQSLLATRLRTYDMLKIMEPTAHLLPNLFSFEMWGGATFDVAYRFLKEDPWERLAKLRQMAPNILFQMLFRGSNAVGYTNYPDNVIRGFIDQAAKAGMDVFRIFDSLNWIENMRVAIEAVREADKVAEAAICYTGDILDARRTKYNLAYYVNMAKELEQAGSHILAIKDMAGVLKPEAAYQLVSALKDAVDIPIHLHTHDCTGNGIYLYTRAIEAGVDIVDVAMSGLGGMTSQPSANTLYYALEGHARQPKMDSKALTDISRYWEDVRTYYKGFEAGVAFPNPEVYTHAMPGGQYSNLQQQAKALGLEDRWLEVQSMYGKVNDMFGDIVKVTPSSKVVGDMALYMVQNNLTEDDIYERGEFLDFPNSVVEFFRGQIGQPYQGFPKELQRIILKGQQPLTQRAGALLEPLNVEEVRETLREVLTHPATKHDVLSYALYPQVFLDWVQFTRTYGDVSVLDTPTFLSGLRIGEEIQVEIEKGKTLIIKLLGIGEPNADGTRTVTFELNGLAREVTIRDKSLKTLVIARPKADKDDPRQIGSTMAGTVLKVLVEKGGQVKKGDHLLVTEAMKMQTTVQAPFNGTVKEIHVKAGDAIYPEDLLLELTKQTGH